MTLQELKKSAPDCPATAHTEIDGVLHLATKVTFPHGGKKYSRVLTESYKFKGDESKEKKDKTHQLLSKALLHAADIVMQEADADKATEVK